MDKGVIIVDFDNVFYGVSVTYENLLLHFSQYLSESMNHYDKIDSVEIRLYGGWKNNASFTQQADTLRSILSKLNSVLFPIIYKRRLIRGNVVMATSQVNVEIEWQNTMQEKSGRHFLKVKTEGSNVCNLNSEKCPVHLIANATRGKEVSCPNNGCKTIDVKQLIRMEQKMVDSMMTCDILEYVHDNDYRFITVVSDDVDLHPAMVLAGKKYAIDNNICLILMVKNKRKFNDYKLILSPYNINVINQI